MHQPDFTTPLPTHFSTGYPIPQSSYTVYGWLYGAGRWEAVLSTTDKLFAKELRDDLTNTRTKKNQPSCYIIAGGPND